MIRTRPLALTAALALALTACTPQSEQTPAPLPTVATASPEAPAAPEPTDHEHTGPTEKQQAIALEAARIMTTWTPAEDATRTDAEQRARHLMTAERAKQITAPARPAGGAEWNMAAEAGASSVPDAQLNDRADAGDVAVIVTWMWQTPDGGTLPQQGTPVRWYTFSFEQDKIAQYAYQDRVQP